MTSEDLTIPVGKYDFIWATHDHSAKPRAGALPPLVVMIHGFPGDSRSYGDAFGDLSRLFVRGGMHTLRFDMRGCGESNKSARFFTLKTAHEDCTTVLRWAQKLGYQRFHLVAEDLGAIVALTVLTDSIRPKIGGLALLWPILDPKSSWYGGLQPQIDAAKAAGTDHIVVQGTNIGLNLLAELHEYDLAPLMKRVTMPTFVQHGTADSKAPVEQLNLLAQNAGTDRLEIVTFAGGEHGLKNPKEREQLLAETRGFFKKIALAA